MNAQDSNKTMAVFLDLENIALGAHDAHFPAFNIQKVLERLLLKGHIVVKKPYCDFDRYKTFKRDLQGGRHGFVGILGVHGRSSFCWRQVRLLGTGKRDKNRPGWMAFIRRCRQPTVPFLTQAFDGQADDVAIRARNALDEEVTVFLDGVGARLVEGIHPRQVALDERLIERAESDGGRLREHPLAALSEELQTPAMTTSWVRPLSRSSMRYAASRSAGLPNSCVSR